MGDVIVNGAKLLGFADRYIRSSFGRSFYRLPLVGLLAMVLLLLLLATGVVAMARNLAYHAVFVTAYLIFRFISPDTDPTVEYHPQAGEES